VKILITGGAGFIGSHLVRRLVADQLASITVLDNFRCGRREDIAGCLGAVRLVRADVRDLPALREALRGVDLVFHLAAQSSVMRAAADASYPFEANVLGTFNVLQAAADNGVRRVVFASSREVYGEPDRLPVPETATLRPRNAYAASKVSGEAWCGAFCTTALETVILRLANVYGPGDRDRVIPLFVENALAGGPLVLHGGRQILDFVWIDAVVDALVQAGFGPFIAEPLNIASGQGVPISELSARVLEAAHSTSTVRLAPARAVEVTRFVADVTRAQHVLGRESPPDPLFGLDRLVSRDLQGAINTVGQQPMRDDSPWISSV
jgi:UDP-glucose 4-epimerase